MKRAVLLALAIVIGVPIAGGFAVTLLRAWSAPGWHALLATPGLARSVLLSLWTGVAATLLAVLMAHALVALAGARGWLGWLRSTTLPLLALPHLAVGIGLVLLLAPSGLLLRLLSPWLTGLLLPPDWITVQDRTGLSLIFGLTLKETPFLVLMLIGGLAQVPAARIVQVARTLGYGPLKAWFLGVAPLLQRQLGLPMAATAVYGITNVEMAIPLAPQSPPPLSILLWQWFTSGRLEMIQPASAGTVLLLATTAAGILVSARLASIGTEMTRRLASSGERAEPGRLLRALLWATPLLIALTSGGAVAALVLRGEAPMWRFPEVLPAQMSGWHTGLPAGISPAVLGMTLRIAAAVTVLAVTLTLLAAEVLRQDPRSARAVTVVLFLPLLLPQLAFLFGLTWLATLLHIEGSPVTVAWTHLIFALPYTWGLLWAARQSIDARFGMVGACLGAGALRRWYAITAPLLLRTSLLAAAIAFAVSTAQYLSTIAAGAGRVATVSTEAAGAASSGVLRLAAVYAAPQALLPLVALAVTSIVARLAYRRFRGMPG